MFSLAIIGFSKKNYSLVSLVILMLLMIILAKFINSWLV
jgi:hypothetical protein